MRTSTAKREASGLGRFQSVLGLRSVLSVGSRGSARKFFIVVVVVISSEPLSIASRRRSQREVVRVVVQILISRNRFGLNRHNTRRCEERQEQLRRGFIEGGEEER
jgi:hypothetical protein